ncbi:hypothetical protein [Methylobacterium sp. 88A]|uniref:hypothetical protein n=1 Tax=Methylobacterium sp. 88A TaxID=1131813 RepID=UPI0009D94626|nr:hypothetical protein [Methylobacterium sp. 88A]
MANRGGLQGVNVTRGLFWLVATAVWIALVAWMTWANVSDTVRGRYQFTVEMQEGVSNPFETENMSKPFLEVFRKPSEGKHPPRFDRIEYRYQDGFDASVKSGPMLFVDFPDDTLLYANTAFDKAEQDLVARNFRGRRWPRRLDALGGQAGLLRLALVPPLLHLAIWFAGRWIVSGFRRAA